MEEKKEVARRPKPKRKASLKLRRRRSSKYYRLCYNNVITMETDKETQINISNIKIKHVLAAQGYLRQTIKKLQLFVIYDIINAITLFYAKPIPLKIQHGKEKIKLILYCSIDDSWTCLQRKILVEFSIDLYAFDGLRYIDGDIDMIVNGTNFVTFEWNPDIVFKLVIHQSCSDNDDDSDYCPSTVTRPTLQEQLKKFSKIAETGRLFLKYMGTRRRKPQDRIIKVLFDNKYRPKQISWGTGSRHIEFSDILYISWGHWTPMFDARKDELDERVCFSVVGKNKIMDLEAQSVEMAELWVKGLRRLIGQSDEKADLLAKQGLEICKIATQSKNKDTEKSSSDD